MENERNYFFRDLIVKILLVLLFVFLLMWLFPMPNMNPLYDKIFTQNMTSMTDAAKGYFTVSRLPQKEGESKKLTLADMINNKMIIEFTDSEGKTCDVNESYVEVTKKDGEYVFKTNLVCSTDSDYVIEYFGCYDVCEDGGCEVSTTIPTDTKKVTEYRFYKEISSSYIDKYICKEGYSLEGTKCVLNSEVKNEQEASMKCSDGYSFNSKTNKCEKINTTEINAVKNCPSGYVYASSLNKCIKGEENEVDAEVSYKCTEGVLVGNKCVISSVKVVDAKKVYSCSNGTLNGTKCIISGTKEVDAKRVYSCTNGTLDGDKCIINNSYTVDASVKYSCSSGSLSGSNCVIQNPQTCGYSEWVCSNKTYTTSMSTSSTSTFTRRYLYAVGTKRVYEECSRHYSCSGGGTSTVAANKSYYCNEGTLDGTKCIISNSSTVNANVSYECTEGKLSGNKCIINTSKETNANLTYKCDAGTLNNANMCEIVSKKEVNAQKVYNCTVGELKGDKCLITGISETDTVYKCEIGTLKGNKCLINTVDIINPTYYCQTGILAGDKCYTTSSTTSVIDATAVIKTKTEKVYKWSTSEKLDGWIRTGETRTSNVAITSKY